MTSLQHPPQPATPPPPPGRPAEGSGGDGTNPVRLLILAGLVAWLGIAGPAKLPADVTDKLAQAIREIAAMPEVERRLTATGQVLDYRPAAEYRERLAIDQERLGTVIRDAGIAPN